MRSAFCSILFACLGLVVANGRGESTATSDIFLNAYLACGSAEKLEATGDTAGAIESYKRAITLLDQVTREDPAWKPDMVKRRREMTSGAIARLEPGGKSAIPLAAPLLRTVRTFTEPRQLNPVLKATARLALVHGLLFAIGLAIGSATA